MHNQILVTLGPSSLSEDIVKRCSEMGIHVFRINLSHTRLEDVGPTIERIRSWTDVPVCLDTEGAQVRNGSMATESTALGEGDTIIIHFDPVIGDANNISFSPPNIARRFAIGDEIRIDYDHASIEVVEMTEDSCIAKVLHGGAIGSNKAADLDRDLGLDPLTEKDKAAIAIGFELGIRDFALSFANSGDNVDRMREFCGENANIICKIESPAGIVNLEDILEKAGEVLIDRGDLSRTIPIEKIPFLQRRIIASARARKKPVFVATNLLESMVTTKSPNRAEVNDVVSTLLMGANGLVLAAETAIGRFPVEAVEMIRRIMDEIDKWTPNSSITDILRE